MTTKTEVRQIVVDNKGTRYYLIKANRVNWVVERISDGNRMQGNAAIFKFEGVEEVEAPKVDSRIRIGAMVTVAATASILSYTKFTNAYDADQQFVIIGFGKAPGEFKIIELGGNARNTYYNIHGKDLVIA
jgi:hypothetical protein